MTYGKQFMVHKNNKFVGLVKNRDRRTIPINLNVCLNLLIIKILAFWTVGLLNIHIIYHIIMEYTTWIHLT